MKKTLDTLKKERESAKAAYLNAVEEQLMNNEPVEVRQTLERLISEGWSEEDSKLLIAQCLIVEFWGISKFGEPFSLERYVDNLKKLPEEPFENEEPVEETDKSVFKNIGRNEKITVEYLDGSIIEDVKFKKVKSDLMEGVCKLIK